MTAQPFRVRDVTLAEFLADGPEPTRCDCGQRLADHTAIRRPSPLTSWMATHTCAQRDENTRWDGAPLSTETRNLARGRRRYLDRYYGASPSPSIGARHVTGSAGLRMGIAGHPASTPGPLTAVVPPAVANTTQGPVKDRTSVGERTT